MIFIHFITSVVHSEWNRKKLIDDKAILYNFFKGHNSCYSWRGELCCFGRILLLRLLEELFKGRKFISYVPYESPGRSRQVTSKKAAPKFMNEGESLLSSYLQKTAPRNVIIVTQIIKYGKWIRLSYKAAKAVMFTSLIVN